MQDVNFFVCVLINEIYSTNRFSTYTILVFVVLYFFMFLNYNRSVTMSDLSNISALLLANTAMTPRGRRLLSILLNVTLKCTQDCIILLLSILKIDFKRNTKKAPTQHD